jgi:hypothetical protein
VSVPFWIHLSLVDECRRNADRALDASWDQPRDNVRTEMKLSNALAGVLLQMQGPPAHALKAAEIAKRLEDKTYQTRALLELCEYHTWRGANQATLSLSHRIRETPEMCFTRP